MNASSLPNNFATSSINVQTESPISSGNNSQTATTNSNGRREELATAPQQSGSGANSSERTASSASGRASAARPSLLQNLFHASLPNLTANGQPQSNTSVISVTTLQPTTVFVSRSRNASGNQPATNNGSNPQSAINSLRDLFNFGSGQSTGQQPTGQNANVDRESSATSSTSNGSQNTNSSNQNSQQSSSSSSFFRMPPITRTSHQLPRQTARNPIGSGFDPHLPCTSIWLIPEIRFVLFF